MSIWTGPLPVAAGGVHFFSRGRFRPFPLHHPLGLIPRAAAARFVPFFLLLNSISPLTPATGILPITPHTLWKKSDLRCRQNRLPQTPNRVLHCRICCLRWSLCSILPAFPSSTLSASALPPSHNQHHHQIKHRRASRQADPWIRTIHDPPEADRLPHGPAITLQPGLIRYHWFVFDSVLHFSPSQKGLSFRSALRRIYPFV